jgi:DNA-binding CsgD family transcriptional regulator
MRQEKSRPHRRRPGKAKHSGSSRIGSRMDALLLRLHAVPDITRFWAALQGLLARTVPYDALVLYVNFLDFSTSWKAEKILATPNARRPMAWFEDRRQVDMTPQFVLAHSKRLKLYRLSDVISDNAELQQTAFYRNFLEPGGWRYLAVSLYWRGSTVISEIALRRTHQQGDFTAHEMKLLREFHPHFKMILDRLLTTEEERSRRRWLEDLNYHLPFALMFLNWELEPTFTNKQALEYCAHWNAKSKEAPVATRTRPAFRVPGDIIMACNQLKTAWLAQQTTAPKRMSPKASIRLIHPHHSSLTATVAQYAGAQCPAAHPGFAIYLENRAREPGTLPSSSLLQLLSPSERVLALLVGQGLRNQAIATQLGKSIRTVKTQLTSIFRKCSVSSRSELLVRLR